MKNIELEGADFLLKQMKAFGPTVEKKATKTGIRKAARQMQRALRSAAPTYSGRLRKQIGVKVGKKGIAWIGLRRGKSETQTLYYYKTLDMKSRRGGPLNPWFENAAKAASQGVTTTIIDATTVALYDEAAKVYKRSMRNNASGSSASRGK